MTQLITNNLAIWTTAPNGIKKLRELILELAVRGLLVPQDTNDEPASALLTKIAAEKARLVSEGGIKKQNPLPKISEDEKPFALPDSWEWCRIWDVTQLVTSGSRDWAKYYSTSGAIFITMGNLSRNEYKLRMNTIRYVDLSKDEEGSRTKLETSDLLLSITGDVGNLGLVPEGFGEAYINQHTCLIRFMPHCRNLYFPELMRSPLAKYQFNAPQRGIKNSFRLSDVGEMIIPLPPLAEQHRIVTKVDELMQLCDQLEQKQNGNQQTHRQLVSCLLTTLTEATDAQVFQAAWSRIAANFDCLFTTESSIEQLKQTILQLAVMGKLVPQNPNDEPASELLNKITTEKARLIAEGKIKKQNPLPKISEQEKPFVLPDSWEWVRFGLLVNFKSELVRPEDFADLDQVAPDSIEKGTGKLLFRRTVSESGIRGPNNRFYSGQILYSKIRPSLSKAIIASFEGLCSADMYPLESMIDAEFLLKTILSEPFLQQVRILENRIKMPKLNVDSLSSIAVPLPPLKEQHRIVAKVDELMTLCEQLKTKLATAQTLQQQLAETLVQQAVA